MNNQLRNPKQGILHLVLAVSWLLLGIWEIADDEGRIFRGIFFLVFAILWAAIYFNELKKFRKEK